MVRKSNMTEPFSIGGQTNLIFTLRNLWRDMATWIRAYLISRSGGSESAESYFNRLYQIPLEFGNIMQYFFGYEHSQYYVQSLSQQLILFRSLIEAQLIGDTNLADQVIQQIYQLADERARYANALNPFWDVTELSNLSNTFIQFNINEILAILAGDYKRDIDIFDRLLHHTDLMGNYFAIGLLNYLTYSQQNQPILQQSINM